MKFSFEKVVHYYYVIVLAAFTSMLAYGTFYYWNLGLLNVDYVSNLYDGTNKIKTIKAKADAEEIRKFVDGDRVKDAQKVFERFEADIHELKLLSPNSDTEVFEGTKKLKENLNQLQNATELPVILNNFQGKVASFEAFVTEKRWPTLMRMSGNLRVKSSPSRIMNGGMFSFEKTQNLSMAINNDLEAMNNFVQGVGLPQDIKTAIFNRIKVLKTDSSALDSYIEEHKKFNKTYKEFNVAYSNWFKAIEPEIALKKIQFEKGSQTIIYSLIFLFSFLVGSIVLGFSVSNFMSKKITDKNEKDMLKNIKENLLASDSKLVPELLKENKNEFVKLKDYAHKRMSFGSIFQEAMPFASILLDTNLNLVWGNTHFFEQWNLKNFNDNDDSLTWDFLQRFTNLEDNSSVLNALRMSTNGHYKIQMKTATMSKAMPYEMYISPIEYGNQKRIMIIFYPLLELEEKLVNQLSAITGPINKTIDLLIEDKLTSENKKILKSEHEKAGIVETFNKLNQYSELAKAEQDYANIELEKTEASLNEQRNMVSELRKLIVSSFETHRDSIAKYNLFKTTIMNIIQARDMLGENLRVTLNSSKEYFKDQGRLVASSYHAEKMVDDYTKSLKTITVLKNDFKDLKTEVEEFRSKVMQSLDQFVIFQNNENDTLKLDQFIGKIKLEMKGFEKSLQNFNEVVTQLDLTVAKIDMMVESRQPLDIEAIKERLEGLKSKMDNASFEASKVNKGADLKDDEMIVLLKSLVVNMKSEMKRIDEMCRLTGLTSEQLEIIAPTPKLEASI